RRNMEKPDATPPRLLIWLILTERDLKMSRGFAIGFHVTRREETHATIYQECATPNTAPLPEYSRLATRGNYCLDRSGIVLETGPDQQNIDGKNTSNTVLQPICSHTCLFCQRDVQTGWTSSRYK